LGHLLLCNILMRLPVFAHYVIRSFFPPFVGAFLVTWFIFVMQFMWVWIDEFIGKGLDVITIIQFLGLLSTTLVPIALPLGILFAALMTYGNLGETSELTAVKASGISIVRFTKPLFIFILFITGLSFLFNNYVIPQAQLKATRLLYDIQNKKPVVAIKPGRFYNDIQNHTIYISSRDADDKTVHDIKIYDHTSGRGNDKITMAKKGKMYMSDDKRFLIFELENGWRYEDKVPKGNEENEQIRFGFKYWKKVFDLSDFKMPKTDESYFKNLRSVMTAGQVSEQVDSCKKTVAKISQSTVDQFMQSNFLIRNDTLKAKKTLPNVQSFSPDSFFNHLSDSLKKVCLTTAEIAARSTKSIIEINTQNGKLQNLNLVESRIELHKRYTLPMACILLFVIGAALGSIIRKGGIGMPFIAAVTFFILYYFMNTIGENIAKECVVSVPVGMWYPSLVLGAIGIYLMYEANTDSKHVSPDLLKRILKQISFKKNNTQRHLKLKN
jgi:lipopolysaccharide export system permease protein